VNIAISDTSLKTRFLGYISIAESISVSSTTFMLLAPEATEFGKKGKVTASMPFKVTDFRIIESSYATSH